MALIDGLIHYWKIDEGVNSSVADEITSGGVTGSIIGATWTTSGKINNALSFGGYGTNHRVSLGTTINPANMTTITISAWIYPTSLAGTTDGYHKTIIGQGIGTSSASYYPFWASISANGNNIGFARNNVGISTTNSGIEINNWYHIIIIANGTSGKIYVNGVLKGSGTIGSAGGTNYDVAIGNLGNTTTVYGNTFPGIIDEVAIFNIEKTEAEIISLYNNGNGLAYPFFQGYIGPFPTFRNI